MEYLNPIKPGILINPTKLQKYNLMITAIQEIKRTDSNMETHTIFSSGKGGGVAFVVDASEWRNIIKFILIDERICILRIRATFFIYR